MSAFLNPYLAEFTTAMPLDLLRRLQGGFEVRLAELREERRQFHTVRELWDSAQVVQMYEEAVGHCRSLIRAKLRRTGWTEHQRPTLPATRSSVRNRRVSAGPDARSRMGHGRPASSRAGSAAAGSDQSPDAGTVHRRGDPPPC